MVAVCSPFPGRGRSPPALAGVHRGPLTMPDKAKPDDLAQSQRFVDMAQEVEADENQGTFDKAFTKVVRVKIGLAGKKDEA